jgi:hypothetical protein
MAPNTSGENRGPDVLSNRPNVWALASGVPPGGDVPGTGGLGQVAEVGRFV